MDPNYNPFEEVSDFFSASTIGEETRLSSGQVLKNVHRAESCHQEHCPIHNPSQHKLRNLPLAFLGEVMVRIGAEAPNLAVGAVLPWSDDPKPRKIYLDPDDYHFKTHEVSYARHSSYCSRCESHVVYMWNAIYDGRISCICGNVSYDWGSEPSVSNENQYSDTSIYWVNEEWQASENSWLASQTLDTFRAIRSKGGVAKSQNVSILKGLLRRTYGEKS